MPRYIWQMALFPVIRWMDGRDNGLVSKFHLKASVSSCCLCLQNTELLKWQLRLCKRCKLGAAGEAAEQTRNVTSCCGLMEKPLLLSRWGAALKWGILLCKHAGFFLHIWCFRTALLLIITFQLNRRGTGARGSHWERSLGFEVVLLRAELNLMTMVRSRICDYLHSFGVSTLSPALQYLPLLHYSKTHVPPNVMLIYDI